MRKYYDIGRIDCFVNLLEFHSQYLMLFFCLPEHLLLLRVELMAFYTVTWETRNLLCALLDDILLFSFFSFKSILFYLILYLLILN